MSQIMDIEPSWKNLTYEILADLLKSLNNIQNPDGEIVALWAEKILRYCEVFLASLRKRAYKKWNKKGNVKKNMTEISFFLFEYYRTSRDIRFLNIVLKLLDMRWIMIPGSLKNKVDKEIEILSLRNII
jgi:hypothetical protein